MYYTLIRSYGITAYLRPTKKDMFANFASILVLCVIITAARPAYAGTEGCYRLRMFFFFFLNESP